MAKKNEEFSSLYLGLGALAVLIVVGVAYFAFLQSAAPTPTPTESNPAITSTGGNAELPAQAVLTGKQSCATAQSTPVLLFHDPYCPACLANEPVINAFYEKHAATEDIAYRFVATHSRQLAQKYGINETFIAHDFHLCAQDQGKIQEFKTCFYRALQLQDGDYLPVPESELRGCATEVGLKEEELNTCLTTARARIDEQLLEAADFGGGTYFTPMAVVGCQYRVNSALVEETYCALSNRCPTA